LARSKNSGAKVKPTTKNNKQQQTTTNNNKQQQTTTNNNKQQQNRGKTTLRTATMSVCDKQRDSPYFQTFVRA
jgi:hypothetical protein